VSIPGYLERIGEFTGGRQSEEQRIEEKEVEEQEWEEAVGGRD